MTHFQRTTAPGYMIDSRTNAIINTDENEYNSYREKVARAIEMKHTKEELNRLKADVLDMKNTLNQILQAVIKNG